MLILTYNYLIYENSKFKIQNFKSVKLRRFLSYISILVLLLGIFSCQKEDDVLTETYNQDISIKEYTFNELNNNNKFNTSFNKVINGIKKNGFSQESRGENNDFEIDSTIIKEITIGNTTSYTFMAILDNQEPNSFNNIVIQVDSINNTKALLITYFPEAPMEYIEEHSSNTFQGAYIREEIDFDLTITQNRDMDGCTTVYYCTWGGTVHFAGENCTAGYIYSITSCGGGGSNNNGGGNPNSGNPNGPDPIKTAPVIIPYEQNVIQCLGLDTVENANFLLSNWINNPNNLMQVKKMSTFLSNKNCSDKAQIFVMASIEAIINGDLVEFDEDFYTWGVTKDSTFEDSELDCIYENMMQGSSFFKDMIFEFDQLTPLKFSIGPTPNDDYAFTKGETTTIFGQTHASYEIISNQSTEEASNLKKIVSLSHELIHAFMYKSLEEFGIIEFDVDGYPIAEVSALCDGFQIVPNVNLNTYSVKDRWVYLICEFSENNPGNQQWTHSLFNSPVFAIETYREKLEQLLLNEHNWDNEPSSLQTLAADQFGPNWKYEVAEYMSWLGLQATPEFGDWLTEKDISYNYWNNSIGPWNNSDWVQNNGVLHNCN